MKSLKQKVICCINKWKTGGDFMYTKEDVLAYVNEENVTFIRLAYFDIYGHQKNISILPDELPRAFAEDSRVWNRYQKRFIFDAGSFYVIHFAMAIFGWLGHSHVLRYTIPGWNAF